MITTAGKTEMLKLWGGDTADAWAYLAVGDDDTAAQITDTALGSELYRTAATVSLVSVLYPEDTLLFRAQATVTANGTIKEVGIFNDDTAGDMLARTVISPTVSVTKGGKGIVLYYVTFKYGGTQAGSGW